MPAKNTPPPLGTYSFVIRKHRSCPHLPTIETVVHGLNGSVTTRDITHSDGVRSQTLFLADPFFRDRLVRRGWEDVTEMWREGNYPNGDADQADALDLARKAAEVAERHGGIDVIDG